jgi:N-acetyl-gamma-glutamyl-phosphate reductase
MTTKVFIDGNAGTTGLQIVSRLSKRPDLTLTQPDEAHRKDPAARREFLNKADVAILCLPDDAAIESVGMVESNSVRIIDTSTAHRTSPDWVYGLPEIDKDHAAKIAASRRVANPGCYPTGPILFLHPLVQAGLIPADYPVAIGAVSGYTGGGRQMIEAFEAPEPQGVWASPHHVYGLSLEHKHIPELQLHAGLKRRPILLPSVGRFRQGMICEIPIFLDLCRDGLTAKRIHEALASYYDGRRFVRVQPLGSGAKSTRIAADYLNGTNYVDLYVFANDKRGQALLVAVLDNLGKGASGAAIQNMNLVLGEPEDLGL